MVQAWVQDWHLNQIYLLDIILLSLIRELSESATLTSALDLVSIFQCKVPFSTCLLTGREVNGVISLLPVCSSSSVLTFDKLENMKYGTKYWEFQCESGCWGQSFEINGIILVGVAF